MLDLEDMALSGEERELLCHPLVGGVILFARNCHCRAQLAALVHSIRTLRTPPLLVAVDQEGGRVQRLQAGFTPLPSARRIAAGYLQTPEQALEMAETLAWLMADELLEAGLDFSFAPVLDLDRGWCPVLADRCYGAQPQQVSALGQAVVRGLGRAGMKAVGKHFPGHGGVQADSHRQVPVDERSLEEIGKSDLAPFQETMHSGLAAVMMAHILFPAVDSVTAGFSRRWLQDVLRRQLGFRGAVFSDDLSMAGAAGAGDYPARAHQALQAGCDMVLICQQRQETIRVLEQLHHVVDPRSQQRLAALRARPGAPRMPSQQQRQATALARSLCDPV